MKYKHIPVKVDTHARLRRIMHRYEKDTFDEIINELITRAETGTATTGTPSIDKY